ncbi:hypothetical protein D3C78_1558860 [compost metagenome]
MVPNNWSQTVSSGCSLLSTCASRDTRLLPLMALIAEIILSLFLSYSGATITSPRLLILGAIKSSTPLAFSRPSRLRVLRLPNVL